MASWTNNNSTYYINPAYLTFVENSGYGANLIQVSASSSCYISVFIPGVIGYSDADKNYRRWKITAYNNKFPDNDKFYIYVRLEKDGTSALMVYDKVLRGVHGGEIIEKTDEEGNVTKEEGEYDENHAYYYIHIGEVSETDGSSIREITYDTGYLTSDMSQNDKGGLNEMFELDKYTTPWLIKAKQWLASFTVKGFVKLIGGLVFSKGTEGSDKVINDIKRSTDNAYEYLLNEDGSLQLDAEGNPVKNPEFVPVSDETLATSKYVEQSIEKIGDNFLRKDRPDETEHRVKFKDGLEAGEYVAGMMGGKGAQIDKDGRGEFQSMTIREFLEVPELRFNRVDVVSGELWNSIAFGLVESVDTVRRICTLKLEEGERSGLHVMDICRGIFSDFGQGNATEEGKDQNGFDRMYGFSTSYFTPTEILVNEEGKFQFRYQLQDETNVHPCASMKFAVYGNFVDASRQASAYSTRTYKRYLNKVNTWKIDPDKHIYAQFGLLDGLTIGGQPMVGYGSYQHNAYLSGAFIQFTPQQKEELKGEDAYSVTLTDYEGIIVIDDEGNVVGGEQQLMNVISDGKNVITENQNVVTGVYRLRTSVQAMRGSTPLFYSLSPEKDSYILGLSAVGCTAAVLNGVVVVTSIKEPKNCHVEITVNCEGKATFRQSYHITAVQDGKNPITADIDNEMDAVACDPDGNVLFGLPVSCMVSMWAGSRQLRLSRVLLTPPEGVIVEQQMVDQNGKPLAELTEEELKAVQYTSCRLTVPASVTLEDGTVVPGITREAERTLPIGIRVEAVYGSNIYHRNLTFTVNKVVAGENAVIYKLQPNVKVVSVDKANKLSVDHVTCSVVGFDGRKAVALESMPETLKMEYAVDGGAFGAYEYQELVSVTKDSRKVEFELYQKMGEEWVLIDTETIYVVKDGNAVEGIREYYLATSFKEGVTREDGEWGVWQADAIPEIGESKKYLWNYEETIYSGTEPTYTEPVIIATWAGKGGVQEVIEWYMVNNDKDTIPGYDDERWVAKKAPQMDKEHRYLWNYEQIKWTDGEDTYTEPAIIGVFGEDGVSSLELVASTSTISRNSFGTYEPDKVRVRVVRAGKEEIRNISAWGIQKDGSVVPVVLDKENDLNTIQASSASVDLDSLYSLDFKQLVFRVFETAVTSYTDDTYIAERVINFVGDGASGPMPRNCGEWTPDKTYYYNNIYRDFVWMTTKAGVKLFIRDGLGAAVPGNDANGGVKGEKYKPTITNQNEDGLFYNDWWLEVSKTVMTAIDTALIDTANIAGFVYKDLLMVSQDWSYKDPANKEGLDATIIMDGKTGFFKCTDVDVRGSITAGSLSYEVKTGGNSLEGYSMAYGPGIYTLPPLESGKTAVLTAYCPSVGLDSMTSAFVIETIKGSNSAILKYDESKGYATYVERAELECNKIYTIIGVGLAVTGDALDGNVSTWFIGSSIGGSGASVLVDNFIDWDFVSTNPVQNKVIASKFSEMEQKLGSKIKVAHSEDEATESGVLYVIP